MAKWLVVSDVVQLLHVPEATIYRWIRQGDIPCVVRRGKHYFNQSTLVTWAESKHIHLEKHSLRESKKKNKKRALLSPRLLKLLKQVMFFTQFHRAHWKHFSAKYRPA
jgi:predicted DNA-binding transcriptional regulator AlpA